MTETRHPDEPRLRKAISDFLAFRSVSATTGPSKADIEVGTGVDACRIVYHAYGFGTHKRSQSILCPSGDSTWTIGRFKTYDEIWPSIDDFLRTHIDQPFLIWRKEPELYFESGYLKAYMRFATTDNPEHFLEAGRQHHAQEEQRFADASRQIQDSKHLAYRPGHGLDLPRLNGQQNGTVEMYPTPGPGETVAVTYEPEAPATLVDCPDCHQTQNPASPLAFGSGTANTPVNENASPEPPEGVLDMRGMLRRTPVPDFEPDLDTEALFQAGRPIL